MAALTTVTPFEKRSPQRIGVRLQWEGTLTGPASYTTGGDTIDPKLLGMTKILGGIAGMATSGRMYQIIPQADGTAKLKAFVTGAALSGVFAEVANATNLSGDTPVAIILGR